MLAQGIGQHAGDEPVTAVRSPSITDAKLTEIQDAPTGYSRRYLRNVH
jgi:hypothetical protein